MTLVFKILVILLASSIWCELSGIRKALEGRLNITIAKKGGAK